MIRLIPFLIIALELFAIYKLLTTQQSKKVAYRIASIIAVVAVLLLFWINGAVGIIGNSRNDANILYIGVIAIAFLGCVATGFKPVGNAWSMIAAAIAQTVIGGFAIAFNLGATGPLWPFDLLLLTLFFVLLWLGAALLFFRAHIYRPMY